MEREQGLAAESQPAVMQRGAPPPIANEYLLARMRETRGERGLSESCEAETCGEG